MVWLIIASLFSADGHQQIYRPVVEFDLASCQVAAQQINARWRSDGRHGYATCHPFSAGN